MEEFDFLVVGSGSGLDVAGAAADRGLDVAVVEEGRLGGTCLNRGCIPSKQLLYHADVLETVERAGEFGIDAEVHDVAFGEVVREVTEDVHGDGESIRRGLQASDQHTLLEGTGRFVGERTVEVVDGPDEGTTARAETVLVAAGTRPAVPPIDGIDDVEYMTSTEALTRETPPDHLVVVGGGYIAAELGYFFEAFGDSDVTIVGRRPELLPAADPEVSAAFTETMADRDGVTVHTGHEATAVRPDGDGVLVEATPYEYGDGRLDEEPVEVRGDDLLVAAGRVPNTDRLDVAAGGIDTDEAGFVETDEYLRTSAEGVWALGDVVGEYLLKHNANHEARTVVRNLFGDELEAVDYSAMPFAVFSHPEVAGVGATEDELRERGVDYAKRTYDYGDTARGDAMHAEGFVKVLVTTDGEIRGCHVVGPEASNLIQEVVVAMTAGSGTVQDIRDAVHIHPALSEVVGRAFAGQFTRPGQGQGHHHDH